VGFAVLLLAMLLTALNYNVSLGFALTFLLAGIGMACMWQAYRNLLGLGISPGSVAPVFAGATAAFALRLHNGEAHARIGIQASIPTQEGMSHAETSLDGEGQATLTLRLPAPRRGRLALPRVTLSSRFPLGLFRVWSHADLALTALVYPAPEPSPPPLPFASLQDDEGSAFSPPADNGADALRRYRVGDPLHRIAWKHSARTGRLLSRTGQAGSQPACWLDWQALPPRLGSEQRLSRLCAWVLAAGDAVEFGLRIPGIELAPGRGASHRRACLEALALWQAPATEAGAPGAGTVT
jgi:uncharacterized protein (DUF58 family)